MKIVHLAKITLIPLMLVTSTIAGAAEDRTKEPKWVYSEVMKFLKLEYADRDSQKYWLKEARERNRALKKIKRYGKLTPADVIAVKWECFDEHRHDWYRIHIFLPDLLREADKKK